MITAAIGYLVRHGPLTEQDRWEEEPRGQPVHVGGHRRGPGRRRRVPVRPGPAIRPGPRRRLEPPHRGMDLRPRQLAGHHLRSGRTLRARRPGPANRCHPHREPSRHPVRPTQFRGHRPGVPVPAAAGPARPAGQPDRRHHPTDRCHARLQRQHRGRLLPVQLRRLRRTGRRRQLDRRRRRTGLAVTGRGTRATAPSRPNRTG